MTGFINVFKKVGDGSTYVVNKLKKKLDGKCGHMGTLDPLACGVLPIGIGKAVRLFDYLLDKKKIYEAEFTFGRATDSLDLEGRIVAQGERIPLIDEINCVLSHFCGEIEQVPPNFSAKMVAGKRGYDLARKGVEFTLPPKKVTIDSLECLGQTAEDSFAFRIECRGGTYIRSLARDIAEAVGTVGFMTALKRTAAGCFTAENAVSLEEILSSDNPKQYLIPTDEAVSYPKLVLSGRQAERLLNGLYDAYSLGEGLYRVYNGEEFWGVGAIENGLLKMRAYCREV